jgi:hypothetical protein
MRVPSYDEVQKTRRNREFLLSVEDTKYTFSPPEIDLALLSIESFSRFTKEIDSLGYVPIHLNDIAETPVHEGQEVFSVGYPDSISLLGSVNRESSFSMNSLYYSLPAFSFGRVSMTHLELPFYWVDMSLYSGSSGGPVIANNKLVGVVSQQATTPAEGMPDIRTRIPFTGVIKASYVHRIIAERIETENKLIALGYEGRI